MVPLLSRKACFHLANILGALVARFDSHGRRVALSNLESAFGNEFSDTRRAEIVRESYQHFARTMLDLFWSPRLTLKNIRNFVEFENLEAAREIISNGCIVGSYHYSNFEWLSLACGFLGYPAAITAQRFKNPLLDSIFQQLRQQSGHQIVSRKGATIRLYKTLRRKGFVALLVDTTLPPELPTVAVNCFGLQTIMTVAHAWLQERTGVPLIPAHCEPLSNGRYRIVFHPKIEIPENATHQEIAQACWDSFEPVVRRNPAPWLWTYKHWRYKPSGTTKRYPFYANESEEFDQIASRKNYEKLEKTAVTEAPGEAG